MKISLVIPAYNEEHYIRGCLESALRHASGRFHEIIVINNGSSDRTSEIAREHPFVRVINEGRRGLQYARQRGLDEATGEFIAFIDADTRLSPSWVDTAEETIAIHSDFVCLSGPYRYFDGPWWRRWLINAICWSSLEIGYRMFGYMVVGGNFIVKKQALKEICGFDTTIEFYGDDIDIGRRIRSRGVSLYRSEFFIYASARRFYSEGILVPHLRYMANFFWIALFKKPFSTSHSDVRFVWPKSK